MLAAACHAEAGRAEAGLPAGPDFILCIGNDRSDEDMFNSVELLRSTPKFMAEVGGLVDCYSLGHG